MSALGLGVGRGVAGPGHSLVIVEKYRTEPQQQDWRIVVS